MHGQADEARAALSEFLVFLEAQSSRVVARLTKYTHGEVQFDYGGLARLLDADFMQYLQDSYELSPNDFIGQQFQVFYDLYLLRDLLAKTPIDSLFLLLQIVHSENLSQRLSRIEGVHGVFTQLGPAAITEIHVALSEPAEDQQALIDRLREYLALDDQHYHLYQTLVTLFCQDKGSLLVIANTLAYLSTAQLALLPRLTPLTMDEVNDIISIFNPEVQGSSGRGGAGGRGGGGAIPVDLGRSGSEMMESDSNSVFQLTVTEQPPDRCVYKRNVKPGPVVVVSGGDDAELEASGTGTAIWMVAILTRCDTEEDCPSFLTGNPATRLSPSRTFEWKRLKVMVTSHQQNETMFALRFELRRYAHDGNPEDAQTPFEVLAQITTNPILVLSHSTQLRVPIEALPSVLEVIPPSGATTGFTRVAILGRDFVESPTTRVRFGNTEVHPTFHGPKTLICRTPPHAAGRVEVRVCNDPNGWSQSAGHFYFDPHQKEPTHVQSPSGMVAFETGFETARVVQRK